MGGAKVSAGTARFGAIAGESARRSAPALRAFDDFVAGVGDRNDDLKTSDFPGLIVEALGIGSSERRNINKKIAHLTHLDLHQEDHRYSYRKSLKAVLPRAVDFCDYVVSSLPDDRGLHALALRTKEVCHRVLKNYVNRAEQGGPPNHHTSGSYGTSAAERPLAPKASGH